jgi:hypothetical protein
MSQLSLIVDGMLSGTGIRDANEGGYVEPNDIGISVSLCAEITDWLERYENAHFHQYEDAAVNQQLDKEGIEIARKLRVEMPRAKIGYYSSAELQELNF